MTQLRSVREKEFIYQKEQIHSYALTQRAHFSLTGVLKNQNAYFTSQNSKTQPPPCIISPAIWEAKADPNF